jgi:hypothetical protein
LNAKIQHVVRYTWFGHNLFYGLLENLPRSFVTAAAEGVGNLGHARRFTRLDDSPIWCFGWVKGDWHLKCFVRIGKGGGPLKREKNLEIRRLYFIFAGSFKKIGHL